MNKHINYGKLKRVVSNIRESIGDIDNTLIEYDKSHMEMKAIFENSLRMSIVQLRESIFDAATSLLKSSNISINNLGGNKEIFDKCLESDYFLNVKKEFFLILTKYRNAACHRYKQPSMADLLDFIKYYRDDVDLVISELEVILGDRN